MAEQIPPVAVLIDGENIGYRLTGKILAQAERLGQATIRHIYMKYQSNNRTISSLSDVWQQVAACYEFELVQKAPANTGRNAVDIALAVGGMDLLYTGIRVFCLATSDADYVALIQRLRQTGSSVCVVGRSYAPQHLREACTQFLCTDDLSPPVPWSRTWEVVKVPTRFSSSPVLKKRKRDGTGQPVTLTTVDAMLMEDESSQSIP